MLTLVVIDILKVVTSDILGGHRLLKKVFVGVGEKVFVGTRGGHGLFDLTSWLPLWV